MKKRVAGVQTNVTFADTQANLATIKRWLADPQLESCSLVVFPECMLSGYCYDFLDEAWPHAQSVPGPATDELTEVCKTQNRFVAFGLLEKNDQGEIYNSCALVGPNGLVGVYRKVHLPYLGIDRFVTRGREAYAVHEIDGLRVGMHICYDGSFPESARVMALQGADLLILPTNWPPGAETFAKYLPNARALENNVYYLTVNRVGNERGFRFIGQSRLCDTNGNSMCDGPVEGEAIISGEIDVLQARNKRLVRVPGKHVIDRMADRCPEYYSLIAQPHNLVRDVRP